jgi:hypothetical protein
MGPPIAGRSCGDCVACCVLLDIDELQKPAEVVCAHCSGTGCTIYDVRPNVCRNYYCAWRRTEAMPESARPDRLRVMFELIEPEKPRNILAKRYIRGIAFDSIEDFASPAVGEVIALFRKDRIPVWLDHGGRMGLAHPRKPIADVLIRGLPAESPEVALEAEEWRRLYADK